MSGSQGTPAYTVVIINVYLIDPSIDIWKAVNNSENLEISRNILIVGSITTIDKI